MLATFISTLQRLVFFPCLYGHSEVDSENILTEIETKLAVVCVDRYNVYEQNT